MALCPRRSCPERVVIQVKALILPSPWIWDRKFSGCGVDWPPEARAWQWSFIFCKGRLKEVSLPQEAYCLFWSVSLEMQKRALSSRVESGWEIRGKEVKLCCCVGPSYIKFVSGLSASWERQDRTSVDPQVRACEHRWGQGRAGEHRWAQVSTGKGRGASTGDHRWSEAPRRKNKRKSLQNTVPLTTENK